MYNYSANHSILSIHLYTVSNNLLCLYSKFLLSLYSITPLKVHILPFISFSHSYFFLVLHYKFTKLIATPSLVSLLSFHTSFLCLILLRFLSNLYTLIPTLISQLIPTCFSHYLPHHIQLDFHYPTPLLITFRTCSFYSSHSVPFSHSPSLPLHSSTSR